MAVQNQGTSAILNGTNFFDQKMLIQYCKVDIIRKNLETRLQDNDQFQREDADSINSPLDDPQITNIEIFRAYIVAYMQSRDDIYQEAMTFLIRSLAPDRSGLPIEVYAFTRTTDWLEYEMIQVEIFDHLLAAAPNFGLRVFQEPTGMDFAAIRSG